MPKTPMLPLLLCACIAAPTLAHSDDPTEQAVEYRSSVMEIFRWNLSPMGAMLKDKIPYDQAAFARHAEDLARAASLDLLAGFPDDSVSEDSDAMSEIWLDWEDFSAKYRDLKEQTAKLAEVAADGDKAAIAEQFSTTAKTCKACHSQYRQ